MATVQFQISGSGYSITDTIPLPSPLRRLWPFGAPWTTSWYTADVGPSVWSATRYDPIAKVYIGELEISHGTVILGKKSKGPITISSASLAPPPGWQMAVSFHVAGMPRALTAPFVLPPKRCVTARFALKSQGDADLSDFVVGLFDPLRWRAAVKAFGPANLPLPGLMPAQARFIQDTYNNRLYSLTAALKSDSLFTGDDFEDGICNPPSAIHPIRFHGPLDVGAPGGSGIMFSTGVGMNSAGAAYHSLMSALAMSRMFVMYSATSGAPLSVDDYTAAGIGSPDYSPGSGDQNNGDIYEYKPVSSDSWLQPYDQAHRIRALRHLIAAWEATGSPLIARHIATLGEQARLQFSETAPIVHKPDYTATNLATFEDIVVQKPGMGVQGTFCGRQLGWLCWAAAMRLKVAPSAVGWRSWAQRLLDTLEMAAMPTGLIQANYGFPNCDPTLGYAQSFEASILAHGVEAVARQNNKPTPAWILNAAMSFYRNPNLPSELYKYGTQYGPPWFVADVNASGQPVSFLSQNWAANNESGPNRGSPEHTEAYLALCYARTRNPDWLEALNRYGVPAANRADKLQHYQATNTLDWIANAYAWLQS